MTLHFDVVVIGAGAAGLPSAWMFLKEGLKVACIEQGPLLEENSFIDIIDGGEIQKYSLFSINPNDSDNFSSFNVDSSNSPIHPSFYHSVGGSTTIFSSQYLRFKPHDFSFKTSDNSVYKWPISYSDLKPYFDLNDELTGVSGLLPDPNYPDISASYMPPVPPGTLGNFLVNGFKSLDWHYWPAHAALNTTEFRGRPRDLYSRPTNLADPTGSKGSVQHTYLPLVRSLGLVLFPETKVLSINADSGLVDSINIVDSELNYQQIKADKFILACGGIGTPRLLLSSPSPNGCGLSNSSGLVGKNLMLHPYAYAEGYFHEDLVSNFGPQGCCIMSHEFFSDNSRFGFDCGFTMQSLRGPLPLEFALNFTKRRILKPGANFWESYNRYYNKTAHITAICEDLPYPTNYVELNHSLPDKHGVPSIKVHYSLSPNSKKMLSFASSSMRKVLSASGAYKTFASAPVQNTGWHILGTCRMGLDPQTSVVNEFGQSHDLKNMFIVDASVFPTSSSVNPASTIQALSLYLSSGIITNNL